VRRSLKRRILRPAWATEQDLVSKRGEEEEED
jgi:hypothetical protein